MRIRFTLLTLFIVVLCTQAFAQRKMEKLGRGVVAIRTSSTKNLITWRLLGTEPQNIGFNIYRSANGGDPVKLNSQELLAGTNFEDLSASASAANTYIVKPVVAGVEKETGSGSYTLQANTHTQPFYRVPIRNVPGYHVRYVWVGDLDGDGEYDYIIHKNPKPGSNWDVPDLVEAYKSDGTYLWTVDMGPNSHNRNNISPGSSALNAGHGDNMTVYDITRNGRSELILRTSNGVKFADGSVVSDANNSKQFISIVDGLTGSEISRTLIDNPYLSVGPMNGHMGIAYLDGINPSVVLMGANRNSDLSFNEIVNTWNWNGSTLMYNWQFDLAGNNLASAHQIKIFDIDGDGKDEIVPQAFALDDDGTLLYNLRDHAIDHGDRFFIADMDPSRPGLEMYGVQQGYSSLGIMWYYSDAKTGKTLLSQSNPNNHDIGRGMTGDFDPRYPGHELYTFVEGLHNVSGAVTSNGTFSSFPNLRMYWDGDLGSELLDNGKIVKWNYLTNSETRLYTPGSTTTGANITQNGRTTPAFYADIIGDWREEAIYESTDGTYLVVFTTPYFTDHRIYTLPHNPGYRNDMAVRGYFQSHNTDYFIGYDMQQPPLPPIQHTDIYWDGNTAVWDKATTNWSDGNEAKAFADGDTIMFDIRGTNTEGIELNTTVTPGKVWVINPENKDYAIAGGGKLTGTMDLWKAKLGSFTLAGNHDYTGATIVSEGIFNINGSLQSKVTVKGLGAVGGKGTLAGGLVLDKAVSTDGGRISPGFGNTAETLGTLIIGGDLAVDGSNFEFDVVPGSDKVNDSLVVTGNLTVSGENRLILNFPNNEYAPGTYTLIRSNGTLSASTGNFVLEGVTGVSTQLLIENNEVKVRINIARAAATIVWSGVVNNSWDFDNENFKIGETPTAFVSGDALTFDATAVRKSVVLNEVLYPASVTFDSEADYTVQGTGSIGGTTDLVKNNTNNLSLLSTANTYTGKTIVNSGTLTVAKLGLQNEPSSIGAAGPEAENIQINNANFIINERSTTDRAITITGTSTITVPDAANYTIFNADIVGNGSLVKEGEGSISMVGPKSFTGPVVIKSGRVNLRTRDGNVGGLGTSNEITLENATLAMEDVRNYAQAAWNLTVPEGKTATLITDGRSTLLGKLKGAGTLNVFIPYVRTDFKGDWSEFTGRIVVSNSDFRIANVNGYGNAAIHLSSGWLGPIAGASTSIAIGEFSGVAGTALSSDNRTANWVIGAKNTDGSFAGNIIRTSLTKVGTGTLTLTGNNRYTGTTNVDAGRILVNNRAGIRGLGSGTVTVASGATLGGTGSVTGSITVQSGGILQPGSNGIGTFTDSTSVNFASGAIAEMEINKGLAAFDMLRVVGPVTFNGTLRIQKIGGADFAAGDSYQLFQANSYNGNFSAIEPQVPGPGLIWNFTPETGTLSVGLVTSLGADTHATGIEFYPNPVTENLNISLAASAQGATVKVYNSLGAVLISGKLKGNANIISLKGLPTGIYFVQVTNGKATATEKIIKE
ncbi:T9SS type A sorting domain-containing protein [Pontibacter qinzhouensis]|uniref:T9SS type A sorting domain-containing protein n=1 Tax=Pontibacter qinzhouensis TaxID=2603253 RepID=A0A5C8J3Y2_9BACT|nr:T9SS type A sorting domain-containing protein [Pontibacter qinzhouensis]TXK29683.1 T9SS type A sorting domain-containing protein [Pontibacter qinzhouensis]